MLISLCVCILCVNIYGVRSIQCSKPAGSAVCSVKPAAVEQFGWSTPDVNPGQPNEPLSLPCDSKGSSVGQRVLAFPVLWLSPSPGSCW